MKQTIEKVLDTDVSLVERIRALCHDLITIISIFTAFSMTNSTIVLTITDVFWVGPVASGSTKDEETLKKMVK